MGVADLRLCLQGGLRTALRVGGRSLVLPTAPRAAALRWTPDREKLLTSLTTQNTELMHTRFYYLLIINYSRPLIRSPRLQPRRPDLQQRVWCRRLRSGVCLLFFSFSFLVFAFLNGWGGGRNKKKKTHFMTCENYIKSKLQSYKTIHHTLFMAAVLL